MAGPTEPLAPPSAAIVAATERGKQAVAEAKALREITLAIRGTQWGKQSTQQVAIAVARYCIKYGLDATRHVEVLGGNIYLTGTFYLEAAAPLILDGRIRMHEPLFVQHDARLTDIALGKIEAIDEMKEWAGREIMRRMQARIDYGIPDDATGACVYKCDIPGPLGVSTMVGFNWCGGATKVKKRNNPKPGESAEYRGDPIGDAEPVKTAQLRAARRLLRQVVVAFDELGKKVGPIEEGARIASAEVAEVVAEEATVRQIHSQPPRQLAAPGEPGNEYGNAHPGAEPLPVEPPARSEEDERFEKELDQ